MIALLIAIVAPLVCLYMYALVATNRKSTKHERCLNHIQEMEIELGFQEPIWMTSYKKDVIDYNRRRQRA